MSRRVAILSEIILSSSASRLAYSVNVLTHTTNPGLQTVQEDIMSINLDRSHEKSTQ